jgi:hypothetical protein
MAETLTLTVAETKPANPKYDIAGINETWLPAGQEAIEIRLLGANGEVRTILYGPLGAINQAGGVVAGSPTGRTLLRQQNKANFSVNSREKAIYNRLSIDFPELAGNVTGVPD